MTEHLGIVVIIDHRRQQNHLRELQILRSKGEYSLRVFQDLIGEVAREGGLKGEVEGPRKARRHCNRHRNSAQLIQWLLNMRRIGDLRGMKLQFPTAD